jgi:eukaryotic-like serine/threonine-protein kinase
LSQRVVVELTPGGMLAGKYRVEKLLGQGGMGAVYLAENLDIGRKVAIKVLHADFAGDANIMQRFRMEARAAAAIGHPGIVDVLDLGATDDGAAFIVMERLDGETLGSRLAREKTLPPADAVALACEALDALAAAHDKGIVHRDLKPENVFLCARPERRVKLLDFGISKFAGPDDVSLTATGMLMGSPLYMSPEQVRNAKDTGPATDLYSMGAILYEALGGMPPYGGATFSEVLANVLMEAHRPLVEVNRAVPVTLSRAVDALLAKTTGERPADARAACAMLRRALDEAAPPSPSPSLPAKPVDALAATGVVRESGAVDTTVPPVATTVPPVSTTVPPASRRGRFVVGMVAAASIAAALVGVALWHSAARGPQASSSAPSPAAQLAPPATPNARAPSPPPTNVQAPPPTTAMNAQAPPTANVQAPPPTKVQTPATPNAGARPGAGESAQPRSVVLTLSADAPGAVLTLDGERLDCNPCAIKRDNGTRHLLAATANGRAPSQRELLFDRPRSITLHLDKLPEKRPAPITIDKSNPFN